MPSPPLSAVARNSTHGTRTAPCPMASHNLPHSQVSDSFRTRRTCSTRTQISLSESAWIIQFRGPLSIGLVGHCCAEPPENGAFLRMANQRGRLAVLPETPSRSAFYAPDSRIPGPSPQWVVQRAVCFLSSAYSHQFRHHPRLVRLPITHRVDQPRVFRFQVDPALQTMRFIRHSQRAQPALEGMPAAHIAIAPGTAFQERPCLLRRPAASPLASASTRPAPFIPRTSRIHRGHPTRNPCHPCPS